MRESIGKGVARTLFYRECLPSWLSPEQIRSGNYLVLLGDEPRELTHLDALSVPRARVWSVERVARVYHHQLASNLGVSLYYGEMSEYLDYLLHANQGFLVLNLDIEGSYRANLDPAMTSVLLFCWRNPETVVATYSSIGRDTEALWEGIKSLATLHWLAPEETREAFATLARRYEESGFTEPVRMALRDLFWIRSHLEHAVIASGIVQTTPLPAVGGLLQAGEAVWAAVRELDRSPLRLGAVQDAVERVALMPTHEYPAVGVSLAGMMNVIYNAEPPWSHRCYFAKFAAHDEPVECREWVRETLRRFINVPLIFINRLGERHEFSAHRGAATLRASEVLWPDRSINRDFQPRRLAVQPASSTLAYRLATIRSLEESRRPSQGGREVMEKMARRTQSNGSFMRDGRLTDHGRERIRALAAQGLSVAKIRSKVPASVPERVVRAYVAVAHRTR